MGRLPGARGNGGDGQMIALDRAEDRAPAMREIGADPEELEVSTLEKGPHLVGVDPMPPAVLSAGEEEEDGGESRAALARRRGDRGVGPVELRVPSALGVLL